MARRRIRDLTSGTTETDQQVAVDKAGYPKALRVPVGAVGGLATFDATTAALAAHVADTVDAHDASAISFAPVGTIAGTDVQTAVAEVASESVTADNALDARLDDVELATRPKSPPIIAASPPTVTTSFSATTTITSSVLVPWNDTRLEVLGAALTAGSGIYSTLAAAISPDPLALYAPEGWPMRGGGQFTIEFELDGSKFELFMNDRGGGRLRVAFDAYDGLGWQEEPVANWSTRSVPGTSPDGVTAGYLTLVDFTTRAFRRVRVDFSSSLFGGIRIEPTASVRRPPLPSGPRILIVGDSYTQGTTQGFGSGNAGRLVAWAQIAARSLGFRDIWVSGVGSTGFQNPGTRATAVFSVTLGGTVTGGSFTLTADGITTASIAYNAAAATVQTALEAIWGAGNITVSGSAGGPWTCTLAGSLVYTPVRLPHRTSSLTGSGASVTVAGVTTGGTRQRFSARLAAEIAACNPDAIWLAGGLNDIDTTSATVYPAGQATALAVLRAEIDACLAASAGRTVIAIGPWAPSANAAASSTAALNSVGVAAQLAAACTAAGAAHVNPCVGPWITGNGRVGTTTGSGNADLYTGADAAHPSADGHRFLAGCVAAAIAAGELLPLSN